MDDISSKDYKLIAGSEFFDATWYANTYLDVRLLKIDPLTHYLRYGALLRRNPSPKFDAEFYIDGNRDVRDAGVNPLVHYLSHGKREGRKIKPVGGEAPASAPAPAKPPAAAAKPPAAGAKPPATVKPAAVQPVPAKTELLSDKELVVRSGLFDAAWYRSEYSDVAKAGIDPYKHYMQHGMREGRNPGPHFDTAWYRRTYAVSASENPLISYLRSGIHQGYTPAPRSADPEWWEALAKSAQNSGKAAGRIPSPPVKRDAPPAIIIPVYNAASELDDCLASILRNTRLDYRVIVIDDASPDRRVEGVLDAYRGIDQIEIYRNPQNLGFSGTINRGIELAGRSDVVFLNSDTIVTPNWLGNMRCAAYSTEKTGTVTAVSNNAGAFSVPLVGSNALPEGLTLDQYARAVSQTSLRLYPTAPTGNGFCLYVRRDCLDDVGILDAKAFPRGYGEENDFCMRGGRKGWRHVIDDATLIYHVRSASFGEEKNDLMTKGRGVVDARYPEYTKEVKTFLSSPALKAVRARVAETIAALEGKADQIKPRALYVLSTRTGGTPQTNQDLMEALDGSHETLVLRCNSHVMTLILFRKGGYKELERHVLAEQVQPFPHRSADYDRVAADWMLRYQIELLHVRHIGWHSLGLVDEAKALNIPVVFSFHDFYTICPSLKLLDGDHAFCGGNCTASKTGCNGELWPRASLPDLKHAAVHQWQRAFAAMLEKCDAFVTTSPSAAEIVRHKFPATGKMPFPVIPHGRDFTAVEQLASPYVKGEQLRVLVPGNIDAAKGADVLLALSERARQHNLEFHILGSALGPFAPAGGGRKDFDRITFHGTYDRAEFSERVRAIRPHVGAVLSIWPETFCHTLTEMWSCGLPVIGFDIGAVGDRLRETGAGWAVKEMSAEGIVRLAAEITGDPARIGTVLTAVKAWQDGPARTRSCAAMADDYRSLYAEIDADRHAGRVDGTARASRAATPALALAAPAAATAPGALHYDVDVIVPVFNAFHFTKNCIESLQAFKDGLKVHVIVVDDGSEEETQVWLKAFCARTAHFTLIRHEKNRGYTQAINAGMLISGGDYVITLNSDTIVTRGWLKGMIRCMDSDPKIGIVGPMSNAASWQNVPALYADDGTFAINDLPSGYTVGQMAALVARVSRHVYPRAPFANGFCYMIKRAVVDAIGHMDAVNFPIGYGEENDYCIRAAKAGYDLAYADDVYVFHAKSKSFGHDKRKTLAKAGSLALRAKHGKENVERLIEEVKTTTGPMDAVRDRVIEALAAPRDATNDPRGVTDISVLFLLPAKGAGGGVHSIIQEVTEMRRLGVHAQVAVYTRDIDFYLAQYNDMPDVEQLFVSFVEDDIGRIAAHFEVVIATIFTSVTMLERIVAEHRHILPAYYVQDYEPLFFESGSKHWTMARDSYELIPQILCFAKTHWIRGEVTREHNVQVAKVMPSIDHEVYKPAVLRNAGVVTISAMIRPKTPRRGAAATMRVLSRLYERYGDRIDIQLFGCDVDDAGFMQLEREFPYVNHGVLRRLEVAAVLGRSDIFLDLSTYQAFGRTALEAMACGCVPAVPVVGGANEFAVDGENAMVVDTSDEDAVFAAVCPLIDSVATLVRYKRAALTTAARYSVHAAAISELTVFHVALQRRATVEVSKAELFVARQKGGDPTGSGHVRVMVPYSQAGVRRFWNIEKYAGDDLPMTRDADTVLVQRDLPAHSPQELSAWLRHLKSEGKRIVYEVDDDLINSEGMQHAGFAGDTALLAERVSRMAGLADLVTVSTEELAERFRPLNANVRVVPNYLDFRLWRLGHEKTPTPPKKTSAIKIGYIGTPSHYEDLAMVRKAVQTIEAEYGRKVEFEVIGVFQKRAPLFGKRIGLPQASGDYPSFVEWLFKIVDWDIAIAPLKDTPFNSCKSNLKFLEYAALRLPIIVSDVPTYRGISRSGENCLTTGNSTGEWTKTMKKLIDNEALRKRLRREAFAMVNRDYTLKSHVDLYRSVLSGEDHHREK